MEKSYYKFQTCASLIEIPKTKDYISQQQLGGVSIEQIEQVQKKQTSMSKDDILKKFSDRRIKKTKTIVKEKKVKEAKSGEDKPKRASNVSMFRYYVPLLFLSGEGKNVIRKCKVMNVKEDKKYDNFSKNGWEVQYGQILPFIVADEDGRIKCKKNASFNIEQFLLCGGLVNSKFWDINLRYAQVASPLTDDGETYTYILGHLNKWATLLPHEQTRIPRVEVAIKKPSATEQSD